MLALLLALASTAEDRQAAMSWLSEYSRASGRLSVYERRCDTGLNVAAREITTAFVSQYVRPEMVEDFMRRTFDDEIRRISMTSDDVPCDMERLRESRKYVPNFKARAEEALDALD